MIDTLFPIFLSLTTRCQVPRCQEANKMPRCQETVGKYVAEATMPRNMQSGRIIVQTSTSWLSTFHFQSENASTAVCAYDTRRYVIYLRKLQPRRQNHGRGGGRVEHCARVYGDKNLFDRRIASVYIINHPWHFGVSGEKPKS